MTNEANIQSIDTRKSSARMPLFKRIVGYVLFMLLGVMLRTYYTHTSTVVWIVNFLGLVLFFLSYLRYISKRIAAISILYILLNFITIVVNPQYVSASIKGLGTNINILVLPVFLVIIFSSKSEQSIDKADLVDMLKQLSIIGLVCIAISWIIGFGDIVRIARGMSAYRAELAGVFYGKNIYGAFVALTLAADLFLLHLGNRKWLVSAVIKLVAVIVSFSRAALLLAFVMLAVYIWLNAKKSMKNIMIALLFGCILFVVWSFIADNQFIISFIEKSVLRIDVGDAGRSTLRAQAISRVGERLTTSFFGVGYSGIESLSIDIDNTYLYIWFSGGIMKIMYYLGILCFSLRRIKRVKGTDSELYKVCLSVFVAYLFFAFFESVAVLELGLLNFLFTLFILIIPMSYFTREEEQIEK